MISATETHGDRQENDNEEENHGSTAVSWQKGPVRFHWDPITAETTSQRTGLGGTYQKSSTDHRTGVTTKESMEKSVIRGPSGEKNTVYTYKKTEVDPQGKTVKETTSQGASRSKAKNQTAWGSKVQKKMDAGYSKRSAVAGRAVEKVGGAALNHFVMNLGREDDQSCAAVCAASTKGDGGQASADCLAAEAGTFTSTLAVGAYAGADVAKASAKTKGIGPTDFLAAGASAEAVSADASANFGVLGGEAKAGARVAKASAGIEGTPLQAQVQALSADAGVSLKPDDISASVGASLAEAQAGPFGVRAGLKFGGGIRNGVPQVDMGPVTVPCTVM